jgi:predicted nuclease of restriction endonuclease-like (RecB) superfamily
MNVRTNQGMEHKIIAHYHDFLRQIKEKIRTSQYEAAKVVNTSIITLYWDIGSGLSEKIKSGWGKSVVETLSNDIQKEFPGIKGFSSTNLWYMKQFFEEYRSSKILQPLVGEISWSKHLVIMANAKTSRKGSFIFLQQKNMAGPKMY